MESTNQEAKILLAIQALEQNNKHSVRSIAKAYSIPRTTLRDRKSGRHSRDDRPANSRKMTDLEESVLVQQILDLDSRGFPPLLSGVGDMANSLLATRDA